MATANFGVERCALMDGYVNDEHFLRRKSYYTFFTPNSFLIALGPCYATVLFALFCIARQLPNKTGGFQIKPAVPNKTGGFQIKPAVPNKTGSFQIKPAVPNKTGGFQINPAVTCDSYLAAATVQRSHKKTGSCQ